MPRYATARSYVYRMFDVGTGGRIGYYIDAFIYVDARGSEEPDDLLRATTAE